MMKNFASLWAVQFAIKRISHIICNRIHLKEASQQII
nr:MAG TPA: Tetracycline resistance leader peptide [Bacteriophage sp.]